MRQLLVSLDLIGQLFRVMNPLSHNSLVFRECLLLATILQLVGLACISIGLGLFSLPLGIVATGVSCIFVGLAFERGNE